MIAQDYQHHTMKNYVEGGQTMIKITILDRNNKPASGFFSNYPRKITAE